MLAPQHIQQAWPLQVIEAGERVALIIFKFILKQR
jgi:hypothetical protein